MGHIHCYRLILKTLGSGLSYEANKTGLYLQIQDRILVGEEMSQKLLLHLTVGTKIGTTTSYFDHFYLSLSVWAIFPFISMGPQVRIR